MSITDPSLAKPCFMVHWNAWLVFFVYLLAFESCMWNSSFFNCKYTIQISQSSGNKYSVASLRISCQNTKQVSSTEICCRLFFNSN